MVPLRSDALLFLAALSLTAIACDTTPSPAAPLGPANNRSAALAPASSAQPKEARVLGAPIVSTNAVTLATLAHDPGHYAQQTIKTEGRVTAVCQAMGCWMEITDANSSAHVRMTGHSFFIPKDASGHRAILQGTVLAKPDDGECEQEAKEATGKQVKLEIDATGVELL